VPVILMTAHDAMASVVTAMGEAPGNSW
jgi:hypothetical protein